MTGEPPPAEGLRDEDLLGALDAAVEYVAEHCTDAPPERSPFHWVSAVVVGSGLLGVTCYRAAEASTPVSNTPVDADDWVDGLSRLAVMAIDAAAAHAVPDRPGSPPEMRRHLDAAASASRDQIALGASAGPPDFWTALVAEEVGRYAARVTAALGGDTGSADRIEAAAPAAYRVAGTALVALAVFIRDHLATAD